MSLSHAPGSCCGASSHLIWISICLAAASPAPLLSDHSGPVSQQRRRPRPPSVWKRRNSDLRTPRGLIQPKCAFMGGVGRWGGGVFLSNWERGVKCKHCNLCTLIDGSFRNLDAACLLRLFYRLFKKNPKKPPCVCTTSPGSSHSPEACTLG